MTNTSTAIAILFATILPFESQACQPPSEYEKQEMHLDFAAEGTIVFVGKVSDFTYEKAEDGRYCVSITYQPTEFLYGAPVTAPTLKFCEYGILVSDLFASQKRLMAVDVGNIGIIGFTTRIPKVPKISKMGKYRVLMSDCSPYLLRIDHYSKDEQKKWIANARDQITKDLKWAE